MSNTFNVWTEYLKWRSMLWQMRESLLCQTLLVRVDSDIGTIKSSDWPTTTCVMTLHNFPPFFGVSDIILSVLLIHKLVTTYNVNVLNCVLMIPLWDTTPRAHTSHFNWRIDNPFGPSEMTKKDWKCRNIVTHNIIWANQKTESFVYC